MSTIITNGKEGFFSNISDSMGGACTIDTGADLDTFMEISGADYGISRIPAPHPTMPEKTVPNQYFLVRESDNVVVSPKTVTSSYGIITPTDMADSVRDLVDGGFLQPSDFFLQKRQGIVGQKETLIFRVADDLAPKDVNGEKDWRFYLLLTNPHGSGKVTGRICSFRPFCTNQIAGILKTFDWSVSHSIGRGQEDGARRKVLLQTKQWEGLRGRISVLSEKMGLLANIPLTYSDALDSINNVLRIDPNADKISSSKKNVREAILEEFSNHSRGTFGRNAFDLYMGVTAYITHGSRHVDSKATPVDRAASALSGAAATLDENFVDHFLS